MVLSGSVRQELDWMVVTFRLVIAATRKLWLQLFYVLADPARFVEFEQQIASSIMMRIGPESLRVLAELEDSAPHFLDGFPVLLAAEALLDEGNPHALRKALNTFRQLHLRGPCRRAPSGIAQCHYWRSLAGFSCSTTEVSEATEAARRAMEMESSSIYSLTASGCASMLRGDLRGAEDHLRAAVQLDAHAPAIRLYAHLLMAQGRFDQAMPHLRQAQLCDPFSTRQKVVFARFFFMSGRYAEGLHYFSSIAAYGPIPLEAHVYLVFLYALCDQPASAIELARTLQRSEDLSTPLLSDIALALILAGDRAGGQVLIQSYDLLHPHTATSMLRKAFLCAALENTGRAETFLQRSIDLREMELCWLNVDPRGRSLCVSRI
jgi:tetratricopeptide (TPR) repeat protein